MMPLPESELDRLFDLSLDLFCVVGIDGYFKRLNAAFESVLGYSREELLARPFFDFVHVADREATRDELTRLENGGVAIRFQNRYICKDGSVRWLSWSASAATQDGLIYAIARDMTEAKNAREEFERLKTEFFATVGHELRTPLTSLRGSLGLLASGAMGELNEEAADVVRVAERSAVRLAERFGNLRELRPEPRERIRERADVVSYASSPMKVLVVDDEEDVRFVARVSLGRVGGMNVIEASSGEEGIARAKTDHPDFILLDVMMPGMDGAATFKALRACEDTAAIPIVFLTARSMTAELKPLGARGIITKPFNPLTLASEVTALLQA
jgi:PAS domain S-box-containing protein